MSQFDRAALRVNSEANVLTALDALEIDPVVPDEEAQVHAQVAIAHALLAIAMEVRQLRRTIEEAAK